MDPNLTHLFEKKINGLPATKQAKAYIQGLFELQARSTRFIDLSSQSLVLAHIESKGDLTSTQELADWVLWMLSWFPFAWNKKKDLVQTIGQLNYYRCYRLVPTWKVYEELADMLPIYTAVISAH